MDVVEHTHTGTTPTGYSELYSGQVVTLDERSVGLETRSSDLHENQQSVWATGSGPIRIQANKSVPTLLQLATRSVCRSNGRLPPGLVNREGFCQSPLEPCFPCFRENTSTESRCGLSGPSVEGTTMVCPPTFNAGGPATPPTFNAGGPATPPTKTVQGRLHEHSPTSATAGRMEHLRKRLQGQGLSDQAMDLIRRSKTNKSYDSLFGRWNRWCIERGSDPFSGPVSEVANFLAVLYQEGYQYNSVNAYRSAISSVHEKVDDLPVGQHPMIIRLVKGVFNNRPPIPRYSATWDVQTVLNYLESQGRSDNLPLKVLTLKTVFLLSTI